MHMNCKKNVKLYTHIYLLFNNVNYFLKASYEIEYKKMKILKLL